MSRSQRENSVDTKIRTLLSEGRETALSEVQLNWGKLLYGLAYRITGSEADAEECVNDALLDLWKSTPIDAQKPLLAYVSSLVRRRAVDRLQYNRAQRRGGGQMTCSFDELDACLFDPEGQTDVEITEIRDALQAFLDGQNKLNRTVFMLRYYTAFSNREVADRCGLSERAVEMRLNRMRTKLRHVLHEHGVYI